MITKKTLNLSLKSLRDFAKKRLPDEALIAWDERDECPVDIVRHMSDPDKLGMQLLFLPEEYGGLGGSTMDVYLICEQMARIDLGVATSLFATFLGSDPITFGATPEQKKKWLGKIADEGALFAYGATEPDAGSDLGALKTTAERVLEDGKMVGYKLNGSKQWISNGGIADHCTILAYLLDLIPEPQANNPDLARFANDQDGLKRDLFARIQARGERATPALVEKELAALERGQAALGAIQAVQAAGGTAHYYSVDLADSGGVAKVMEQVRQHSGRIDVLLHAAGLERSHLLPDKDPREFDLVFDVKADGWFNLLHSVGDMPLAATVAFSSVAGRFGNGGQGDYSAANDLLCKFSSSFRTTRPETRGIVIDWTAWGGIGMATRGSIPKMMEAAGIEMLPPEAGIPLIRRELTSGGTRGEIVVGLRLGALLNEWDPTGGLDTAALSSGNELLARQGPMGKITGVGIYSGLTMETTLDPKVQPFLNDHRIDGTPVLPGVMGIEAFAEAVLCLHPGWHIETIEEVNFLAPFKFYKDEPRKVTIRCNIYPQGEKLIADCCLVGRRRLAGQTELQETRHFTARVRVAKQAPDAIFGPKPRFTAEGLVNASQIYRIYFHGPAYQVVQKAWWDGEYMVGELTPGLPDECTPPEVATIIGPRLIELCFQTAGLWEIAAEGRMGLPWQVGELSWLRTPQVAEQSFYALVKPDLENKSFDAEVVDAAGRRYLRLVGYRTAEISSGIDSDPLKALHDAVVSQTVS